MNLVRSFSSIGILTLISRVLGFVRDMLMARFLGAGFASDAFLIAFRLPNMFRALFAEGAFASAFVPSFNRKVGEDNGRLDRAFLFAEQALAFSSRRLVEVRVFATDEQVLSVVGPVHATDLLVDVAA